MSMTLEELGKNIEYIRVAKGWTIHYAAQKAMIGWKQLENIEIGKGNPTMKVMFRIADSWQVPIGDFFNIPGQPA